MGPPESEEQGVRAAMVVPAQAVRLEAQEATEGQEDKAVLFMRAEASGRIMLLSFPLQQMAM